MAGVVHRNIEGGWCERCGMHRGREPLNLCPSCIEETQPPRPDPRRYRVGLRGEIIEEVNTDDRI